MSKNDRLGRNPFDKRTYAAAPKSGTASAKRAKAKPVSARRKKRARIESSPWRLILNEILKLTPPEVKKLKICSRVRQAHEAWQQLKAAVST